MADRFVRVTDSTGRPHVLNIGYIVYVEQLADGRTWQVSFTSGDPVSLTGPDAEELIKKLPGAITRTVGALGSDDE